MKNSNLSARPTCVLMTEIYPTVLLGLLEHRWISKSLYFFNDVVVSKFGNGFKIIINCCELFRDVWIQSNVVYVQPGGCCLRFQSRRLPLGLGYRVGLRESSESVAVEDYRRCHAVPGLVQQMKGVKDGVFGVSSLSIDFINFMRTCFLLLNLKFYIIPDPWVVFLMQFFCGRITSSTALTPAIFGWLSTISAVFLFFFSFLFSSLVNKIISTAYKVQKRF